MVRKKKVWSAMVLLTVMGVAVGSMYLFSRGTKGHPILESPGPLLSATRRDAAVCVQSLEPSLSSGEAVGAVRAAMGRMAVSGRWKKVGLDRYRIRVEPGCPGSPLILRAKYPLWKHEGENAFQRLWIHKKNEYALSPYRVHLYVISKELAARAFETFPLRTEAEELLCEGKADLDCAEVTTGLYLTPEEVRDPDTLKRHLMIAFGLDFPEELLGVPHPLKSADEVEPR